MKGLMVLSGIAPPRIAPISSWNETKSSVVVVVKMTDVTRRCRLNMTDSNLTTTPYSTWTDCQ